MKICFFADASNIHVQCLAPRLAARGHDVQVVLHKPMEIPGVTVERFRVPGPGLTNPYRWEKRWVRYLRGFLQRFDIVLEFFLQDWGFTPEIIERGCFIAAPRGSDIVPPPGEDPPTPELIEKRIALLRHAHLVGTPGPRFANSIAAFAGLDVDQIHLLPQGVDPKRFRPAGSPPRRRNGEFRVGYFKGFREVYGPTYLIRAIPGILDCCPDVRFDLVGDGPQLATCQALAGDLHVESSIEWIPRQPHGNIPDLLARWDVTTMPSICESFGVAALESEAMGVPVVASNVGGLPDTVRDGETGLLVPPESPKALAEAIVALLTDTPRRLRMGKAGREWVHRHFNWDRVIDQWERTFHRALDHTSRASRGFQPARISAQAKACGSLEGRISAQAKACGALERSAPQRRQRRVLMVSCAFPPTGGPGVQRSAKFAKYLPQFGWLPDVWTVGEMEDLPRDPTLLSDLPPDVTIHTMSRMVAWPTLAWPWRGRNLRRMRSVLRRLTHREGIASEFARAIDWRLTSWCVENPLPDEYVSWARASIEPLRRLIRKQGIEVIYSTYSPPSNHLLALMLKQRTDLPWIADFRDLWTDDHVYCESSADRRAANRRLEQEILETADAVVGVTHSQTEILARHVPAQRHKFVTITNGFDPADFPTSDMGHQPARVCGTDFPVGLRKRFVLAHVGRFDRKRANGSFLSGLQRFVEGLGANRDRFVLRIVGHANRSTRAKIRATGVELSFTGYVPHAEAVREMRAAGALLLSVADAKKSDSMIPGKLFEYLAAQRPILVIGPSDGECERIVRSCNAGLAVGLDGQAISLALGELFHAWLEGRLMTGCSPSRLEPYSRVTLTRKLASLLDRVAAGATVDCGLPTSGSKSTVADGLEVCV